ncbi:MAG: adenylate/guanylate cyclase domain-containing protein [bacterium]|nr:adenylate/guanylate cyclase domain-containing protein [bacterium]
MRMLRDLILSLAVATLTVSCNDAGESTAAQATRGELNLRDTGAAAVGQVMRVYALDGEWETIRGRQLASTAATTGEYAQVPGGWEAPADGFASYRLKVLLPDSAVGETLALRLPIFSTAYRLYVDGVLLAEVGKAGTNLETTTPAYRKLVKSFRATQAELNIVLHVSNFHHRKGGFIESVRLGPEEQIQNEREIALFMDFFLFGALLIMALYHFGLVLNRRDDIPSLVFGSMCLAVAIRILFTGEYFITLMFPEMPWVWQLRGEYMTFYIGTPIVLSFFAVVFAQRTRQAVLIAGWAIPMVFIAHLLLTPGRVFSEYLVFFQLFTLAVIVYGVSIVIVAIFQGRTGAVASLIGGGFFGGAIMHDILVSQGVWNTPFLAPFGLFLFIFAQSYLLSRLFSNAFFAVRRLSDQLQETNNAYSRFVPREFLEFLEKDDITQIQLGDQVQREMTVLFTDIRSFTNLSERMSPGENFDFLNSYLKRMTPIVREMGGFIDKYIGDSIMALFPDGPGPAIQTAIKMQQEIRAYNRDRSERNLEPIEVGMGIHTGTLMLGTIGAEDRMEGTVISDTVNVASRIEGLTRNYGSQILVTADVREQLGEAETYRMRYLGQVPLKGKTAHIGVYEVLDGLTVESAQRLEAHNTEFARAITAYQEQRYPDAHRSFQAVLDADPKDEAARHFLDRSRSMMNRSQ